jgi:hypothetical protein
MSEPNGEMKIPKSLFAAIGSLAALIVLFWGVARGIVTTSQFTTLQGTVVQLQRDFSALSQKVADEQDSIDRFFGNTAPKAKPSAFDGPAINGAIFTLVQMQTGEYRKPEQSQQRVSPQAIAHSYAIANRRAVIPLAFIRRYGLEPATGRAYLILGEDQKLYSLDDVLAALIQAEMAKR